MKKYLLLFFLFASYTLSAQLNYPKRFIQVSAGYSNHGTGDMKGIQFATEYGQYFAHKLSWIAGISGTIHDGSFPIFFKNQASGNYEDGSVRYTTAGVQLTGDIGYSPLKTNHHEIIARAGVLARYQSSSLADIYSVTYPPATDYPIPFVNFYNRSKQQTISVGYNAMLGYNYTFDKGLSIGFLGGLQNDTEGDLIYQLALSVGKRF